MQFDPRELNKANSNRDIDTRSYSYPDQSFTEFLYNGGHGDLSAFAAIELYKKTMPLFNAVDMRATAFSQIPIRLWDKKKLEFIDDHPVLELLEKPNADMSQMEFLEQISNYYDITGNSFTVATGTINKPPLELINIPPQFINFGFGGQFGLLNIPSQIDVNVIDGSRGSSTFRAEENMALGLRFISPSQDKEIWHSRTFNPTRSGSNFWGMSRARSVWLEIEQYLSGNKTNLSMLKRGTRLSMAWVNKRSEALTDTQWSRLKSEGEKYAGDTNAGGTPILDGMEVMSMQVTNRDMEFKDLQESMFSRISTNFAIPLPLLLSQSMTLDNLKTSMLQFYDRSVLPVTKRHYNELTRFLLPRYKDSEDLEFKFNESDVSALRARMIDTAKAQSEVGVSTDNELRSVIGYEALPEGGDVVWKPFNLVPQGVDGFTNDNLTKPKVKANFIKMLEEKGIDQETIADSVSRYFGDY